MKNNRSQQFGSPSSSSLEKTAAIPPAPIPQLDQETIKSIVETQLVEVQNEALRLKLKERELDLNAEYAKESLKHQAEFLAKRPIEERKTITRVAWIVLGFTSLLLGFVVFCLLCGEREFITKVLKGLGYLVTTALGYYLGQKSKDSSKSTTSDGPGAEVVNE